MLRSGSVRIHSLEVPTALHGRILVDAYGIPRYWVAIWLQIYGPGFSDVTLTKYLDAIEKLYRSVETRTGTDCLDRYITDLNFDQIEISLTSLFASFRNRPAAGSDSRWRYAVRFIRDCLIRLSKSVQLTDSQMGGIEYRLRRLNQLYTSIQVQRPRRAEPVRALPSVVVQDLYDIITPDSSRNPFRTKKLQWRNFALFLLLLHEGLRRSEALSLPIDAVKHEWDMASTGVPSTRYWLDVSPPDLATDSRSSPASLKNDFAIRQIPVSADLANVVRMYTDNYRSAPHHGFLFASQGGAPLSKRSVNNVFVSLTEALSDSARKALRSRRRKNQVTPHDLRHTCAVVKLTQFRHLGYEMDMAIQKLRVLFGWSHGSRMPNRYARSYFEDQLATIWQDKFSEHVDALRDNETVT